MAQDIVIGGRLHSAATGNTVAGANEILDDAKGKKQNVINQEVDNEIGSDSAAGTIKGRIKNLETAVGSGGSVDERIAETKAEIIGDAAADYNTLGKVEDKIQETKSEILGDAASDYNTLGKVEDKIQAEVSRSEGAEEALDAAKADKATTLEGYGITDAYTKSETYNKTEVNGLVDTPHQNYVTVLTYAALIAIDPGSTDTIYRVSNYDGSVPQVDVTKYSEYAWDGTQYVFLCVKSQIDEVFDISVYNNNATYADLAAALGTDGANVPQTLRRGGMSVKFVCSSDNKYVQYRLMSNVFSTMVTDWQGVDDEPTAGSDNLVKSGGVFLKYAPLMDAGHYLVFEQGGILWNGEETETDDYIRTTGYVKSPFSLTVNQGYTIFQVNLYDDSSSVVQMLTNLGTSYSYDGQYKARIVICKEPVSTIRPDEDIIQTVQTNEKTIIEQLEESDDNLNSRIEQANERLNTRLYNQCLYLKQGGLLDTGVEVDSPAYITTGFLKSPFNITVNQGYTIFQANLYRDNGSVVQMLTNLGTSYSYNGSNFVRLVFCKDPLSEISITDDIIASFKGDDYGIIKDIYDLKNALEYGSPATLRFEQGGILYDGQETDDEHYVRNVGFLKSPLMIQVLPDYEIYQMLLYDNGVVVDNQIVETGRITYDGKYDVRIVVCKTNLEPIFPDWYLINSFSLGHNKSVVEEVNKDEMFIAHRIQEIGEPKEYNFCFFDKLMRVSYEESDPKLNKTGLWSDGIVWRNIVDNNLFITGHGFKTIKISDGSTVAGLNEGQVDNIHSVTKLMNLVVVCDSGIDMNTKVTVNAEDKSTSWWYSGFVDVGDEVSIYDLMCSTVVISDNCAANVLARVVGFLINPEAANDAAARASFIAAMNTKAQSLGMTNTNYASTFGSEATSTPTDQCLLAREIQTKSAYAQIRNKWGLVTYQMTITGTNARTYTITNEINSSIRETYIPGFVGGKPGQGGYSTLLFVWEDANNVAYASYIAESVLYDGNCVYQDARRVIDYTGEFN